MELEKVYPKIIADDCQKVLAKILELPITILPESESKREHRYSLHLDGSNHFGATDNGRRVSVVPFVENYWLYFSIEFDVQPQPNGGDRYDFFLKDVYTAIFYGSEATDEDKLLMFRGEWANLEDDKTRIIHPQPHWHIHNTSSHVNAQYVADFNTYLDLKDEEFNFFDVLEGTDVQEVKRNKIGNLSGFHFAMCAGWIFNQSDKHTLDRANLMIWLKQSINHIKKQLEYSLNKL